MSDRRMCVSTVIIFVVSFYLTGVVPSSAMDIEREVLPVSSYGPGVVENWQDGLDREEITAMSVEVTKSAGTKPGIWYVPSKRSTYYPAFGQHNVVNKGGDPHMGIGFPEPVDVIGAWFTGQGGRGIWASAIRATGYRDGAEIATTGWLEGIGEKALWLDMDFKNVDRILIEARPVRNGVGFFGMDNLTYVPSSGASEETLSPVVVDFEDVIDRKSLSDTEYAGLIWERGQGDYSDLSGVPAPMPAESSSIEKGSTSSHVEVSGGLRSGTSPELLSQFDGLDRSTSGFSYPPDTCGAIGPSHYVECVNERVGIYNRNTHALISSVSLSSFFPSMDWGGDPRVMYDRFHDRWIILASGFSHDNLIHFAYSLSNNPTGSWYKTYMEVGQSAWPDYETLGVNEDAIFTASYLVNTNTIAIFVIDKSNLLGVMPSMGTITVFRNLPLEGAIQPAENLSDSTYEYLVSAQSSSRLRVYRVAPPMDNPTITNYSVTVPYYSRPPEAPALGSSTALDTVGTRLMNAVWRDGYLWTTHCVNVNGRAAVRWYQIDTSSQSLVQSGTVYDSSLYYYFPSISVNMHGQVILGFSGSKSNQYASVYACGRVPSDPAGTMSTPMLLKEGTGPQNNIDDYGRNRWGDYSLTTVDPNDDQTFYTAQTYGKSSNIWGTWISVLSYGDCNGNGIDDEDDIANGTSFDCNDDLIPDECQLINNDCDGNGVPDDCQSSGLITRHPSSRQVCEGGEATFSIEANASDPTFRWYMDGVMLTDNGHYTGTTTTTLLVHEADSADEGNYKCLVGEGCIMIYSREASLSLTGPPVVVTHPQNTDTCRGNLTALSTVFSGLEPITYRWELDGEIVPGETSTTMTIPVVQLEHAGSYVCVATNPCGETRSQAAVLTVGDAPIVASGPDDMCVEEGGTAVFTIEMDGTPPYYCLWYHDGDSISIQHTEVLTISDVEASDAGEYSAICVSYSATECEVSVDPATLEVGDCGGVCENPIWGDIDGDSDVDLADFAMFQRCMGPGMAYEPGCECANLDTDDFDIDLDDYLIFGQILAGPNQSPY